MKLSLLLLVLSIWSLFPRFYPDSDPSYQVLLFLSEECVISQSYALEMRRLYDEFGGGQFAFTGVFSNPASTPAKMAAFKEQYDLPFALVHDRQQRSMDQYGVRYTPEVVVLETATGEVLYQGRIDNTFYQIGRRRRVTTEHELRDVLLALRNGQAVPVNTAPTVGCIITPAGDWVKNAPMCQPDPQ